MFTTKVTSARISDIRVRCWNCAQDGVRLCVFCAAGDDTGDGWLLVLLTVD